MARATTYTWLPLDRWSQILGINPIHFNQMVLAQSEAGHCGDTWFQYAWQSTDQTSREDVAVAVREAELMIANHVGYQLIPDWTIQERIKTVRPARPELYSYESLNVRGQIKSVETRWGYIISGGRMAQSLIQAGVNYTTDDIDGDLYEEEVTATVATTVTNPCEVHAYLPGRSGSFAYEIRPIDVSISGGIATLIFKRWQLVDPDIQERMDAAQPDQTIDAADNNSYVTTIDVYRVFNDPQDQLTLLWEHEPYGCGSCNGTGCPECSFYSQAGCVSVRNERLGFVAYRPASWDADNEQFDAASLVVARDPDQLLVSYYSGWMNGHPLSECQSLRMDPYWEHAVVRLSAALLDRELCSCNNVERFVDYWREDLARVGGQVSYQVSPGDLENPFGTTRGGVYAWRQANGESRRIKK